MAKKQFKYLITDTCRDGKTLSYKKESFLQLLKADIADYVDVCTDEQIAWKFSEFMDALLNNNEFSLDINGYLYQVIRVTPNYKNRELWNNETPNENALNVLKEYKGETLIDTLYFMLLIDARTMYMLKRNKVYKVKDFVLLDKETLLKMKGCGVKSAQIVMEAINEVKNILEEE